MDRGEKDFFISYTGEDVQHAAWIAGTLEGAGYTTILQEWDFNTGDNFVTNMHHALIDAERFIAVLSPKYLESLYCQAEWTAAFTKDPGGEKSSFIPVRISDIHPEGLIAPIIYIDLFDVDEKVAEKKLLSGVNIKPHPRNRPPFPKTK